MANNALIRKRIEEIQAQVKTERDWWEKRRAKIQSDFMKELDEPKTTSTPSGGKGSDEDGVLVESGGPDLEVPGQQGSVKKRKGKK